MTITESNPATHGTSNDTSNVTGRAALADQVVLSGAGLASHGITSARRVVIGAVDSMDTIALGTFDIAGQLVDSNLVTELAAKSISVARQAWTIGMDAGRDALNDV